MCACVRACYAFEHWRSRGLSSWPFRLLLSAEAERKGRIKKCKEEKQEKVRKTRRGKQEKRERRGRRRRRREGESGRNGIPLQTHYLFASAQRPRSTGNRSLRRRQPYGLPSPLTPAPSCGAAHGVGTRGRPPPRFIRLRSRLGKRALKPPVTRALTLALPGTLRRTWTMTGAPRRS